MSNKVKILICDDQEADHLNIKKGFVESTFLKDKVEVKSVYFFENSPKGKEPPLLDILNETFEYDIIFLDLGYNPEGIEEEKQRNAVILKVQTRLRILRKDVLLLILSKYGPQISNHVSPQGVPIISKSSSQEIINSFLNLNYGRWVKTKLLRCSTSEFHRIRENVQDGNEIVAFSDKKYYTDSIFCHLSKLDINQKYSYFKNIPNFNFKGWERTSPLMHYKLPVKDYYIEAHTNLNWRDEVELWEKRLHRFINAHISLNYCNINDDEIRSNDNVINLSLLKWDTSKLGDFKKDDQVITSFLCRINTRRLIVFLYLVCDYSPEEIYSYLKYSGGTLKSNAISNGFRYSYYLFNIEYSEEIDKRKLSYYKILPQLSFYDKKILNEICESLKQKECDLKELNLSVLKND